LRGTRLFISGATGFYGKWLLEVIAAANDAFDVGIGATLLSRDPARFTNELPRLGTRPEFEWLKGHADDFCFPAGGFDYVFHLATPTAEELGAGDTALALSALQGTHRILSLARRSRARRLLLASSGAVYGRQPPETRHLREDHGGAPDPLQPQSAYGEIKRMSELLCALTPDVECVVARGFAFVGPHLPLNDKFAIGSFIRDALAGVPIEVRSDGTPLRSYLYAADLAVWLLAILTDGVPNRPYNVGSDHAISIGDLAHAVADTTGGEVRIGQPASAHSPERYVPSIARARAELGVDVWTPLPQALRRTIAWARAAAEVGG
jgi:nucleoside-diphosphate-sugar epimerase